MISLALLALAAPANGVVVRMPFGGTSPRRAEASGIADPASRRKVRIDDPVRIASVSKLAVSLAVLRLVGLKRLDLDRDVSDWLGWRLRNPAFPDSPVTLRQLLSHQSSLTDGADYAIPLGETLRERLARAEAWDGVHAPGHYFRYANLNFPVIASVMEAATGRRFDRLMTDILFRPARIDACFNWQGCRTEAIRHAVVLRDDAGAVLRDDLKGRQPACPVVPAADGSCDLSGYRPGDNGALFSPQGGMRISAKALARLGALIGDPAKLRRLQIDPQLIGTPVWRYDGRNGETESGVFCAYGLAVHFPAGNPRPDCHDDLFGDGRLRFGHSGEAYGLRSGVWVDPTTRRGVAYFMTGLPPIPPKGQSSFTAPEEAMARAMPR